MRMGMSWHFSFILPLIIVYACLDIHQKTTLFSRNLELLQLLCETEIDIQVFGLVTLILKQTYTSILINEFLCAHLTLSPHVFRTLNVYFILQSFDRKLISH